MNDEFHGGLREEFISIPNRFMHQRQEQWGANQCQEATTKDLLDRLYQLSPSGGNLHVIVDDKNLEDEWFEWLPIYDAENPEISPHQLDIERRLFERLKAMSYAERCAFFGLEPEDE